MTVMDASAPGLRSLSAMSALRSATAAAHRRLEADLDLHAAISHPARMRRLLERFWGFHKVWEPAVSRALADEDFTGPRRKLPLLTGDLEAMGLSETEIGALPVCAFAAPPPGYAAAMGAYYVLEGSTLGGRVITHRLKDAGWTRPPRYFHPYGAETGAMWRAYQVRAEACGLIEAMTASAERTFETLHVWLTREEAQ